MSNKSEFELKKQFIYQTGFSRETEPIGYVYTQKETYKESAHMIQRPEVENLQGGPAGCRLKKASVLVQRPSDRRPRKIDVQFKFESSLLENPHLCSGFCSIQFFNRLGETHPHYGGQPGLLKVHQFKYLILSINILTETPRIMFTNYLCTVAQPSQHKINHYSFQEKS